jgi:hypothetical protein
MANQKAVSMTIGIPGVEIIVWYNDANNRIGNIEWSIVPSGVACRIRIWDTNISSTDPVIDRTEGQGSGAETIPGNYQMVEETDEIGTHLMLPPNIEWTFNIRTI